MEKTWEIAVHGTSDGNLWRLNISNWFSRVLPSMNSSGFEQSFTASFAIRNFSSMWCQVSARHSCDVTVRGVCPQLSHLWWESKGGMAEQNATNPAVWVKIQDERSSDFDRGMSYSSSRSETWYLVTWESQWESLGVSLNQVNKNQPPGNEWQWTTFFSKKKGIVGPKGHNAPEAPTA